MKVDLLFLQLFSSVYSLYFRENKAKAFYFSLMLVLYFRACVTPTVKTCGKLMS